MVELPPYAWTIVEVVGRSAVIYVVVVLGLRFAGKGEVGQLSIFDLVALLLLSNAVQNAMVGEDTSLLGGVAAAATILVLSRSLKLAAFRKRALERVLIGEPRVLIWRGNVVDKALREEEITATELRAALRDHGLLRPSDVQLAVLEASGSISVIPMSDAEDRYQRNADSKRRAGRLPRRMGRRHAPDESGTEAT